MAKHLMIGLNETIYQLIMANGVHWHGHILRKAFYIEIEGQRKKGMPGRT